MLRAFAEDPHAYIPLGPGEERVATDGYVLAMRPGGDLHANVALRLRLDPALRDAALAETVKEIRARVADRENPLVTWLVGPSATLALNGIAQRRGKVWRDRYFRQDLTSPQQVRNALVYVLFNVRKHAQSSDEEVERWRESIDPYSSTAWLDGWSEDARPPATELASFGPPIVDAPRSWLLRDGWKRRGRIRLTERPRSI